MASAGPPGFRVMRLPHGERRLLVDVEADAGHFRLVVTRSAVSKLCGNDILTPADAEGLLTGRLCEKARSLLRALRTDRELPWTLLGFHPAPGEDVPERVYDTGSDLLELMRLR